MLAGPDLLIEEATNGPAAIARVQRGEVDLVVADLQIGAMGGMAITMELRNLESYGAAESLPVLMLLDRRPDVFLARRSGADGFVVKPLDPQRVRARGARPASRRGVRGRLAAPSDRSRRQCRHSMSDAKPPPSGLARIRARLSGHEHQRPRSPEADAIHARVDQLSELELRDVMTPRVDVAFLTFPGHARSRSPRPSATRVTRAFPS